EALLLQLRPEHVLVDATGVTPNHRGAASATPGTSSCGSRDDWPSVGWKVPERVASRPRIPLVWSRPTASAAAGGPPSGKRFGRFRRAASPRHDRRSPARDPPPA